MPKKTWKDYSCRDCYYRVEEECLRNPPRMGGNTMATYPFVANMTFTGEYVYSKACAEFKENSDA